MIRNTGSLSFLVFLIISILIVYFNLTNFPGNILSWDVFGYYLYLPLVFIYNNWGLQNVEFLNEIVQHYQSSSTIYQAYPTDTGSWVILYTMGMSILYFPFFIIGHFMADLMGYPQDGFSAPYQTAIFYGGMVYSITGIYLLRKILLTYYSEIVTATTLIVIYLGTNYFLHTGFHGQNAMSHNYLFTLYAAIIWFTIKWHNTYKPAYMVGLAVVCSVTILARPSEIICLIIPVLWGVNSIKDLKTKFRVVVRSGWPFFASILISFIIILPQMLYWKIVAGHFVFNSYYRNPGEGFELFHPFISQVLFSFRKGWLVYTPVMIFAIIGIIILFRQNSKMKLPVLIYFVLNLYVVSSWSVWWFAESLSSRALIQSYALLALPMASFIHWGFNSINRKFTAIISLVLTLCIALNLFQTWQFLHDIIHPSRMTRDAYWSVFLKTTKPQDFNKLILVDRDNANRDTIETSDYYQKSVMIEEFENEIGNNSEVVYNGTKSFKIVNSNEYSPSIKKKFSQITGKDHVKIKINAWIYLTSRNSNCELIARIDHGGDEYGLKNKVIDGVNFNHGKWEKISFIYLTPIIRVPYDKLKIYLINRGKDPVFIDHMSAEIWEPKH